MEVVVAAASQELNEFDERAGGVKALVDSGIKNLPSYFAVPEELLLNPENQPTSPRPGNLQVPVIDLSEMETEWKKVVEEIGAAAETWGIFQITNHGVPLNVMEALFGSIKRFHEQPGESKMKFYAPDHSKPVRFHSGEKFLKFRTWRDTLTCNFYNDKLTPELLPEVCREEVDEYMKWMIKLRGKLCELLSEALGLPRHFLSESGCLDSETLQCHYYPLCPQPNKTLGLNNHTDPNLITILAQDQIGGLQGFRHNHWIDIPPIPGALVVNVGDFLQVITNDKFKSAVHRVRARTGTEARISAACFFYPSTSSMAKAHKPIEELLSDENPAKYKPVIYLDYARYQTTKGECCGEKTLPHFML